MARNLVHIFALSEDDLLILNNLIGESLAKSPEIFYLFIFRTLCDPMNRGREAVKKRRSEKVKKRRSARKDG